MGHKEYYDPEIETIDREKLEALQLDRLKSQVNRCYESSTCYRQRFDKTGIVPDDIQSLNDIRKIPPVTKNELREEQLNHPPFGRYLVSPPDRIRELHPSSGTTGTPVNNLWGEKDVEHITSWTARTLWSVGARPGLIIQNAFSYGLWVAGLSVHYAAGAIGCFVIPIGATMTERQIEYLLNPGSDMILSTPSFALYIAERAKEKGIAPSDLKVRLGLFGGEPGAEVSETRGKIEEGLGVKAHDYYGLAEIGPTFAAECDRQAGLHWAEDHVLIEVIDPETMEPCEQGEPGVLVFTHLTKEVAPMIRYWSNDIASLDMKPCTCGRTHARSPGGIIGRADDLIIFKGAKFYPVQVERVVRGFSWLSDEFRIELSTDPSTGMDIVTVVLELGENAEVSDSFKGALRDRLKEEILVTPAIRFEPHGKLERTMFKAKRIVDLRSHPIDELNIK
jgi:phenylacetate-CoA ligase